MTLATIVGIASCLSSLTIVISLIFVIRQMDLSIRHQRATARHGRVQQLQMLYLQASQGDFVDVLIRGLAGDTAMDAKDCNRFVWFTAAVFNMFEEMFHQHRDEIIDDATFASSLSAMRSQFAMPGIRAAWMVIRGRYEKIYADYVDRLMADTAIDATPEVSSAWRGFVSAAASP
jgi:AcrR family transcriptional regulator